MDRIVRSQTITELLPAPDNSISGTAPAGTIIGIRYNTIASELSDDQILEDAVYTVEASGEWSHVFPIDVVPGTAIEVYVLDPPNTDNDLHYNHNNQWLWQINVSEAVSG